MSEMLAIALSMRRMKWTYQEYMTQPQEILDILDVIEEVNADHEKAEAKTQARRLEQQKRTKRK